MRALLLVSAWACLFVAVQTGGVQSGEKDPPKKEKAGPALKVGDPAPSLKADAWLQGTEVTSFAAGKVYVVEFWATWCGPCIVMMPHIGQLQREFRDKGVTIIGYSAKDANNTREKVTAFVEKRGKALGYTMAFADDRDSYNAWMKAAGQNGIPCCFVVDKEGKIAYIGHPMYLDLVLPRVVEGKWNAAESNKELDLVEADVNAVFKSTRQPDAEAALKDLAEFEKKYPALANIPYLQGPKISLNLKAKRFDEVEKLANAMVSQSLKNEDPTMLRSLSAVLRSAPAKEQKKLLDLSLKAALSGLKLAGDKDVGSLMSVADAYFVLGNPAQAREYGARALSAADNPRLRDAVEKTIKRFEDAKEEK